MAQKRKQVKTDEELVEEYFAKGGKITMIPYNPEKCGPACTEISTKTFYTKSTPGLGSFEDNDDHTMRYYGG